MFHSCVLSMSVHICACLLCCPGLFLSSVLSSLPFMFCVFGWMADVCCFYGWMCLCLCFIARFLLCFLPFGCLLFVLPSFLSLCGFSFLSEFVVFCLLSLTVFVAFVVVPVICLLPSLLFVASFVCWFPSFLCVCDGVFLWVADFNWWNWAGISAGGCGPREFHKLSSLNLINMKSRK